MKKIAFSYLRMSTGHQVTGDSRRRQLDMSRAYAEAEGLELAEDRELEDIGISAYKGKNVGKAGALGQFVTAAEEGTIPNGSYLLVESLDRISRETPNHAMSTFLRIINAGIVLVILKGPKIFQNPVNTFDLMGALMSLGQANEESEKKTLRLSEAWKAKRKSASTKPMTGRCPGWLQLSSDRTQFNLIPDRADIVRSMFNDAASGLGIYSITRRLNKAGILSFGTGREWQESSVSKILASRAVLGEFQPHVLVHGKRKPVGDAVKGYFPAIIDEQLFYQVQDAKAQRKNSGAGRKGENWTNLFTGLLKCIYCKGTVSFENKGKPPRGNSYLVCERARRGVGCSSRRWQYRDFEASFLSFVEEVDVRTIVDYDATPNELGKIEAELAALGGQIVETELRRKKILDLFLENEATADTDEFIRSQIDGLTKKKVELESKVSERKWEYERVKVQASRRRTNQEEMGKLIARLQNSGGEELYRLRSQIAARIKQQTPSILLGSVGSNPSTLKASRWLESMQIRDSEDVVSYLDQVASEPKSSSRFFCVCLNDGDVRVVYPARDNPMHYDEKFLASETLRDEQGLDAAEILNILKSIEIEECLSSNSLDGSSLNMEAH